MIRFYGMSDTQCMDMPLPRFLALYHAIPVLQMEEEAFQLAIVHNGKPGERLKEIQHKLTPRDEYSEVPVGAMLLLNIPGVRAEEESGSILKLRERQKESAIRLKEEYEREKQEAESRGETLNPFAGLRRS